MKMTLPERCSQWWEYVGGGECFGNKLSLYHALCDPNATLKNVSVTSSHKMLLEVSRAGTTISFNINVFLDKPEDAKVLGEIVSAVEKKNAVLGKLLAGVWFQYLENEKQLEKLAES